MYKKHTSRTVGGPHAVGDAAALAFSLWFLNACVLIEQIVGDTHQEVRADGPHAVSEMHTGSCTVDSFSLQLLSHKRWQMLTSRWVLVGPMPSVRRAPSMCASSTRYRFSSTPYTLAHSL